VNLGSRARNTGALDSAGCSGRHRRKQASDTLDGRDSARSGTRRGADCPQNTTPAETNSDFRKRQPLSYSIRGDLRRTPVASFALYLLPLVVFSSVSSL
jgi:hypothetical protein